MQDSVAARVRTRNWQEPLADSERAYLRHDPTTLVLEPGSLAASTADVLVDRRLASFADPLAEAEACLPYCRMLYVVQVPDNEYPLAEGHRSQFRVESFPPVLGTFERIHLSVLDRELLAVYASPEYQRQYGHPRPGDRAEADLLRVRRQLQTVRASLLRLRRGAQRFESSLAGALNLHRSQRAWRFMLAVRKAYMMTAREPVRGPLKFLFGQGPSRAEVEPAFPAPRDFMTIVDVKACPTDDSVLPVYPGELSPPRKCDVVVLPPFDFDRRPQRPQHLATQFAREGHRVFWLSATRVLPPESPAAYHAVPLRDNIWEIHPRAPKADPQADALPEGAAGRFHDCLQAVYREWGVAEVALLAQSPVWRNLIHELQAEPNTVVVFDCIDEGLTVDTWNRRQEPALARECDVLVLSAERQRRQFGGLEGAPLMVPNGAEFDLFRRADPLPQIAALPRPVVGYFGPIADSVDLDLVREVARMRPQYRFVVSGTVAASDAALLKALPNLHLPGARPYEERPRLLAGFDACMLPRFPARAADLTPLYECFAQGKPVVATAGLEPSPAARLTYVANGADHFARELDRALAETDPGLSAERIREAHANTWKSRVSRIHDAVAGSIDPVSIVISGAAGQEDLRRCLRSLLDNTSYPNFEIIVVGRCSEVDPRVRAVPAIHPAELGGYIAQLPAGTLVNPGWLSRLLRHLVIDPSIGWISPLSIAAAADQEDDAGREAFAMRQAVEHRGASHDLPDGPAPCGVTRHEVWCAAGGIDVATVARSLGLRACVAEDCVVHTIAGSESVHF